MKTNMSSISRTWKLFLVCYVVCLSLNYVILRWGGVAEKPSTLPSVELNAPGSSAAINISYQDEYNGSSEDPDVVLLLNITRKEEDKLTYISSQLADSFRVITPDFINLVASQYPGGHSFHYQGMIARQLMQKLRVDKVHVVGYKYGTLAGVHLANETDIDVQSLSLLSSYGVQELELLGGYHLNHGIYTAQLLFLELAKYGIPHFGLIDVEEEIAFYKIMNSSDQRKIRKLFQNLDIPVQIQHCLDDPQVASGIAIEHNRIIPQSKLLTYQCQSLKTSNEVVSGLKSFLQTAGQTDIEITNLDIAQSLIPFRGSETYRIEGGSLVLVMLLIIVSTFVSEDLSCIGAGLMAARGLIGFVPAVTACLIGIFIGDILVYLLGKWLGAAVLKKAPVKWFISERDIERTNHWFEAKGPVIIIISRFIPGSRFPTYLSAGIIDASFLMFILYFGIASIMWTPILVGASVLAGQKLIYYFTLYQDYVIWVLLGVVLLIMAVFKFFIPMLTYRGRRLMIGKWRRLRNWEFWPIYVIYFPIVLYVVYLWIKFKKLTVCTAANPGMPEGGFIGESKYEILSQIGLQNSVASFAILRANWDIPQRIQEAHSFMENKELDFPIVLKPDQGQRGEGVLIIKNSQELENHLSELSEDMIIQEFVLGKEFGVFYYRYPNQEKGNIYSITGKNLLTLTGDGNHTLEHLILEDERAVCMAEVHFEEQIDDLYHIPEKGKQIHLVELGTHARGAVFWDATHLKSPELLQQLDKISKSFEGFYFGRYDLKVSTLDQFKAGADIKVIELNGVTSESTNMYDSEYTFVDAISILCKQWKLCFEIGYQNHKRGAETPSITHMVKKITEHL
ncbi:MAG: hypothetical protein FH748_01860 [Balneolaceae bacterium]|nr:hypothetical protein [Balneolaceae bacterium]